ncbi:MAG: PAS domain-containing protein [Alphaproteobacteria bacterium]|nr:PAS domain-containing protein [Alphaproteobacteria bacterium]
MEFHRQIDPAHSTQEESGDESSSLQTRRHVILSIVAIILFVSSLVGVLRLAVGMQLGPNTPALDYYLTLALTVFSLVLTSIVMSYEARMAERIILTSNFQNRIDQLENRLKYREDMLRLVSDHQPASITIFDRHNRYFFVNEAVAEKLGRPSAELIGQPPIRVLSSELAKKLEIQLAEARASDDPIEVVDRVVDEKGVTRFLMRHYEAVSKLAEMEGCVMLREEDLTNLIVERERREQMLKHVIDTLVAVVDRRDPYASGHSLRVGQLSKVIAEEMGLERVLIEAAEIAGSLMNFGKVLVSRRILTKTSALTPDELQRVRDSILTSADILAIIGFDGPVVPTLRQVLERYDGTGVPEGLKGEDIMVTARIVSAANAFVAFVSPRAHRDGLSFKEALSAMAGEAGKSYDERVLVAMAHFIENRPAKLDWLVANKLT